MMPPHCFCVISLLHYYDVSPDEYTAVLQGAGGQWDVTCSAPSESSTYYITAMTWETADGRELSRSPNSNSILYSAPVEATLEMICYAYTVHTSVQFLQFFVLIAQGTYMVMDLQWHLCRYFDPDMHLPCVVTAPIHSVSDNSATTRVADFSPAKMAALFPWNVVLSWA